MKRLIISLFVYTTVVFATTIHVPADSTTIQAGLNGAQQGDTVLVAAGTYTENITWPATNGIKLIGSSESDCIIDGDSLASVIRFEDNLGGIIDTTTLITGFTIRNGLAQGNFENGRGGGIYCSYSSPSLVNVTIEDNSASYEGGGICCYNNSNPSLVNVTIVNNSTPLNGNGGGMSCYDNSSPSLVNVIISGNSADFGGGINCWNSSNPILADVTIADNSVNFGGAIYCYSSSPTLTNVTITNNTATYSGGGIYCYSSSPTLTNVTIADNSASTDGGIYCYSNSNPNLVNVTITNNTANTAGGIYCYNNSNPSLVNCILWNDAPLEVYFSGSWNQNSIMIAYSDIQGDSAGIGINNNGTVYWETGNIDTDPLFTDESGGDYTLQNGSPCIDAGTAFFVWQGDTLVNLSPGEYVDSDPDMGAFEYDVVSTTEDFPLTPFKFVLHQNYPNPFNPTTTIRFSVASTQSSQIQIFDITGRLVETLIDEPLTQGEHEIVWNAGSQPSGVYFVRLQSGEFVENQKVILLK